MYETFEFNGEKKDWLYIIEGREKPPFPGLKRNTTKVPGADGEYLESTEVEPIVIKQPFGFKIENEQWLTIKDELAAWLYTSDPVPLEFPDEPGRTYYAVVQNSIDDFERVARTRLRQGTIEFLCVDPYAYGTERSYSVSENTSVANEGTADAYPVFDLTVKEETTLIQLSNESNMTESGDARSIYIGTETDVDEETEESRVLVMHDTMQSTSGWTGASEVDNGYVTGQMGVMDDGFYVEDWGEDDDEGQKAEWIGPSLQRSFDDELDSFQADINISNVNKMDDDGRGVGIIEVYMRDANDEMVCKFQFGDTTDVAAMNKGAFATPEKRFEIKPTQNPKGFNDFDGQLRIVRDTGYFDPRLTKIENGIRMKWFGPGDVIPGKYNYDTTAKNPVKKIQIAMRKWVGAKRITMRIKEIKVWDIVGTFESSDKTPVHKFKAGDKIHVDTKKGLVLVNGEERTDLLHLGTDFFTLVEGINNLELSDNVEGSVSYRNRYL